MTRFPSSFVPQAVIFDCDGVLADSEPVVNRVVAADLSALGWQLTPDEAGETFLGMALPDMQLLIREHIPNLPQDWAQQLKHKVAATMAKEVTPVKGAGKMLAAVTQAGLPMALASNSSRIELHTKLERLGFSDLFDGRIFSFEDVSKAKPHPDIYLAAAKACGVRPQACLVVEDSATGAKAAVAAGAFVVGFAEVTEPAALLAVGVHDIVYTHQELLERFAILSRRQEVVA